MNTFKFQNGKFFLFLLYLAIVFPVAFISARERYYNLLQSLPFHTQYFTDYLNLSASEFSNAVGVLDMGSYIKAAQFFMLHGSFQQWTLKSWPVGQPLFLALIFDLFGESHYPLTMLIFSIPLWSLTLFFVYNSLSDINNLSIRFILSLSPLYFETIRDYIFGAELFMSEAITIPLFIISICFFLKWLQHHERRYLIIMAFLVAISAYFRGYFEVFGNFTACLILTMFLLKIISECTVKKIRRPTSNLQDELRNVFKNNVITNGRSKDILIAVLVFVVTLLPGRVYNYIYLNSFSWLQYSSLVWTDFWQPDRILNIPSNQTYNVACHIYPKICEILSKHDLAFGSFDPRFYRDLTLITLLQHPFMWYAAKLKYFNVFWFGDFTRSLSWLDLITNDKWKLFEGVVVMFLGISSTIWSGFHVRRGQSLQIKGLFLFSLLFCFFNVCLFTFFHYEGRYSLYLRIFFIYLPIWNYAFYLQTALSSRKNSQLESFEFTSRSNF